MNPGNLIAAAFAVGLLMALLWIAVWDIFIPQNAPGLAWSGYAALITPMFVVGFFGAAVFGLLSMLGKR